MKSILPLTLACVAALASPVLAQANVSASVNPADKMQSFQGWGTSLAWWANVVGGFPQKIQNDYLDKIFSLKTGLGLNVVRYNIGGGENPNIKNTMAFRARVPGFEPSPGVWDWTADQNQRRVLFEARKRGVNVMEAFSNSPPWWMTISGSVTGAADGGANLKPEDFGAFANYLTTVVQHYQYHWGVRFRTLEAMNESSNYWWKLGGSQEGYHIDASNPQNNDQNRLVQLVAEDLRAKGVSTMESAPDDNTIDTTLASLKSYSPEAIADIGQINTHTYGGSQRAQLLAFAQAHGNKPIWVSEHGDGDGTGMQMSQDILADFKQMGCITWVYWQAVDGGGWGMLVNALPTADSYAYTLSEKYYVMGQYSRYIRPGDRFLAINDPNALAAYRPTTGTLTIVVTNSDATDKTADYDLSAFKKYNGKVQMIRTSTNEEWANVSAPTLTHMHLIAPLKAGSVTTFVISKIWG